MKEDEFISGLESMNKPGAEATAGQRQLRLTLMNTQKSAFWGIWFLALPVFFLCSVVMKYLFHWNWGLVDTFIETMAAFDKTTAGAFLTPVLFLLLPAIGALLNLLSVVHFSYTKSSRELLIAIRLKWFNLVLIAISLLIVAIISLYVITENAHHRAVEQYLPGTVK